MLADISTLLTAVAALATVVISLVNRRAINKVRLSVDGRLTKFLREMKKAEFAKGAKHQKAIDARKR